MMYSEYRGTYTYHAFGHIVPEVTDCRMLMVIMKQCTYIVTAVVMLTTLHESSNTYHHKQAHV
jgi:uncharacterized protein YifN (PemK superfamily)